MPQAPFFLFFFFSFSFSFILSLSSSTFKLSKKKKEKKTHHNITQLPHSSTDPTPTAPKKQGRMIDVMEAPEGVRRECIPNSMCVQFYGPSSSKTRDRDYCWAGEQQLAPFGENLELLETQDIPKRMRPTAFREALLEARNLFLTHGKNVGALHVYYDDEDDEDEDGEGGEGGESGGGGGGGDGGRWGRPLTPPRLHAAAAFTRLYVPSLSPPMTDDRV